MKRKVNVNRKRISSEEIASQKKFSTLIKSYPTLASPIRKTTWRTKSILWVTLVCAALVWYVSGQSEFEGYEVDKIFTAERSPIDITRDSQLRKDIKQQIVSADRISGPVKGIRIELEMTHESDTIRIVSFGGGKYFLYKDHYFESKENLLPDSVVNSLIR